MEKNKYEKHVFEVRKRVIEETLDQDFIFQKIDELINDDLTYKRYFDECLVDAVRASLNRNDNGKTADDLFVEKTVLVNMLMRDSHYKNQIQKAKTVSTTHGDSSFVSDRLVYFLYSSNQVGELDHSLGEWSVVCKIKNIYGIDIEASKYAILPSQLVETTGCDVLRNPDNFSENNFILFEDVEESRKLSVFDVIQRYQELEFFGVKEDEINVQMKEFCEQYMNHENPKMIKSI